MPCGRGLPGLQPFNRKIDFAADKVPGNPVFRKSAEKKQGLVYENQKIKIVEKKHAGEKNGQYAIG